MEAVSGTVDNMRPQQRRLLIGSVIAVFALVLLMGGVMLADSVSPKPTIYVATDGREITAQPTAPTLSEFAPNDVLGYFQKFGIPVSNIATVTTPSKTWQASQGISFKVTQGKDTGSFYLLSYSGSQKDQMGLDVLLLKNGKIGDFKAWRYFAASNVLLLADPNAPGNLWNDMISHMSTLILVPKETQLPRPTATPTAAPPGNTPTPISTKSS
jgi:hypothetical protein